MRRASITVLAVTGILLTLETAVNAETIYGLTDDHRLISFDSTTPGTILSSHPISGLLGMEGINAIDIRPANGQVYGVSTNNFSPINHIYTINPTTGMATVVSEFILAQPSGIDFDPVQDRLRVVNFFTVGALNLRINVDTGEAVQDGTLTFAPGDVNAGSPAVTGIGYTNNFAGAQTTTLFGVAGSNTFVTIEPNSGTLHTVGLLAGQPIGFSAAGFDISGQTGTSYFSGFLLGQSTLFTVDLQTGLATPVGTFGSLGPSVSVIGLAAPVGEPVPEPSTVSLLFTALILATAITSHQFRRPAVH